MRFLFRLSLVAIGLVSVAHSADSLWEPFARSADGHWFVLKGSRELDKGVATVWMVKNYHQPQKLTDGRTYRSIRIQYSFDCKKLAMEAIWTQGYESEMGTGIELYSDLAGFGLRSKTTVYSPSDWENHGYGKFCKRAWEFWK